MCKLTTVKTWHGNTYHCGDIFRFRDDIESLVPNDYMGRDLILVAIISSSLGVFNAGYGEHPIFNFAHLRCIAQD